MPNEKQMTEERLQEIRRLWSEHDTERFEIGEPKGPSCHWCAVGELLEALAERDEMMERMACALTEIAVQPYPEDIFRPIPKGELKRIDEFCKKRGYRIDNLSAQIGRRLNGWIIKLAEEILSEYNQKFGGKE